MKRVGVVAYKLKLPKRLQIHPTIHVSFLKPYHRDEQHPTRNGKRRAPSTVMVQFDREVDRILDKKVTGYQKGGNMITYYLVKWKGAAKIEVSWEKADKCNFYMIFIILLFIKIVSFPLFLLI